MTTAFDPIDLAGTRLANRIAMAPMTRNRAAAPGMVPTDAMAAYYAQRASGGLLISEGIQPSAIGQGYAYTPGLHSADQVAGWRKVTDAVHAAGGRIFAQIMHSGRIGHPSLQADGQVPVAPSAIAAPGQTFTYEGPKDLVVPRELTEAEINDTIADYSSAARNAIDAGFDGVEIHGANGYLIHQFLATGSNQRTDAWGGSVDNRIRFAVEVATAVTDAIGAHRTGLRVSPTNTFNGIAEEGTEATYRALIDAIAPLGLAYLHVCEAGPIRDISTDLRKRFDGAFILNPYTPDRPTGLDELSLIEDGTADILAYGIAFLANPDLPARLAAGGPFNEADPSTFYGGDERGFTDYPALG
ncbi:alkene reductase [Nocardiopsis gilva YIM 90087]|uniref:Alkene reductase n=1 Tax=Nocardiopsis gilva YIM 90087 TaxID=1235441 RepID=A0A223SCN5_9ACTN|nr:alkene reductase [Nocardiopsis gilva]ASU85846.1 alkene reductase [Nocardiopsis gilva YIM 90087]